MDLASINSPGAALMAGLITSLHCAGMCGPLACTVMPAGPGGTETATAYHVARLGAYTVLGALAGGLGQAPLVLLGPVVTHWLPWTLVLLFLALSLRADRWLRLPLSGQAWLRVSGRARRLPRPAAAALLGLATPLLPCGPLYLLLALALLSGSALRGAEFMLTFGLGTVPLLWLFQSQYHVLRRRLSPVWMARVQMALALTTALVIGWRLRSTLGFAGPDVSHWVCCF